MLYLEMVVLGRPISNQTPGQPLQDWRKAVVDEAKKLWTGSPLTGDLKAIIINFYDSDKPTVDVDNMSKPILDVLQDVVYLDDRQIIQGEFVHAKIDLPYVVAGVVNLIVSNIRANHPFVYVRIEDTVTPYPLPR